ncbi:hypothetical protein BVRB_2g032580 [Beta vulgaris subsp. vulgaris]|nr:hypothetical protein BVRB_2g032580 [Beta vulgaris subsp. vulgaris]
MEGKTERIQLRITRLHDAAIEGDVPSLLNLLQEDPFILDRCIVERSGCFVQSPLHVASCLGHLEIVKTLLAVNPNTCFARDQDGRNPVHVAATSGQVHVLDELLRAKPQAAKERTNSGETALHLCVKHSQPEALKFIINATDDGELLNSKDGDGNTVLHLAVAAKQLETIHFLLKHKRMAKNTINTSGLTAMDTCNQTKKDGHDEKIWSALRHAKVSKAKVLLKRESRTNWLEKQRTALMVVSSLIATMAFQAGINPPGGVWQDEKDGSNDHLPGTSIMATYNPIRYKFFLDSNTIGLVSSLSVILLLISGLPCMKLAMAILMVTMWIAISATTLTYVVGAYFLVAYGGKDVYEVITYKISANRPLSTIVSISLFWLLLLGFLILGHAARLFARLIKQIIRPVFQGSRNIYANTRRYPPV